jgi:hypothetical protein
LPRNNMLNMVSETAMLLMQKTVLAAVTSPVAHKAPHRGFHQLLDVRIQVPLGFRLNNGNDVSRVD